MYIINPLKMSSLRLIRKLPLWGHWQFESFASGPHYSLHLSASTLLLASLGLLTYTAGSQWLMPHTCLLLSVCHNFIELMSHEHHDQSKCGFHQNACAYFRIFKMYLLLVFAKCTYFWFCKMYILQVLQNVPTSGLAICRYFCCT